MAALNQGNGDDVYSCPDYLESTNLLPLGVTKSLQTIVSRGFDSELEGFAEAHAACVHFHAMSNDLQKLVSQDWPLDGYKQLAAELSDTTTEELRIRLQPRAAEFLSQAIAGVALCDSIIVRVDVVVVDVWLLLELIQPGVDCCHATTGRNHANARRCGGCAHSTSQGAARDRRANPA